MHIRNYCDTDFSSILNVYAHAKLDELRFEGYQFELLPLDEDPTILAAFAESDVIVYDDDGVLGFAATLGGQLRALFVHTDARRRGVGKCLLSAVLANSEGPISLNVAKSNHIAKNLYEKFGFVVTSEVINKYNGIEVLYSTMSRVAASEASAISSAAVPDHSSSKPL
jgi:putative acetyltransferase